MQVPYFSIILPTFNRASLLPRAIDSVLRQDFPDWELLVIDDGSTDDTQRLLKEYASEGRLRVIQQENRQLNGARNRGITEMRGEYGCFLDDDDEFLDGHLAKLRRGIDDDGRAHDLYRSGEILQRGAQRIFGHNYQNGTDILPQYWKHSTGLFGTAIPRHILRENPFNERHLLLDDFVWLNRVLSKHSLYQLPGHSVLVHQHPRQRSNTYLDESLLHKNLDQLRRAYGQPGVANRVPKAHYQSQVVHQYLHFCRRLIRERKLSLAGKMWWQGVRRAGRNDLKDVVKTGIKLLIRG